jgi:hypothetical protein
VAYQGIRQSEQAGDGEAGPVEELRFSRPFRMIEGEQVTGKFPLFDDGIFHIRKPHHAKAKTRRGKPEEQTLQCSP